MITSAVVVLEQRGTGSQFQIPCHRHGDAYHIVREFGYSPLDFRTVVQGFIVRERDDPTDPFSYTERIVDRKEAMRHAIECEQVEVGATIDEEELFSEDLW